jgi:tRNA(His) 5'-end guanylyltransferase
MKDALGDRMKAYENPKAKARFIPCVPIIARIDGRTFSKFTKGMKRPYDPLMTAAMINTTKHLVEHSGALIGYTQSDEITLIFHNEDHKSQIWFDGREQKMVSQLAAQATLAFYNEVQQTMPKFASRMPTFDARVFQVPTKEEAVNCLIWREWDATKNSISMAAFELYSHKELHKKNGDDQLNMLFAKGINWNDYPPEFKRGTYVKRTTWEGKLEPWQLAELPEKHRARTDPDFKYVRASVEAVEVPPITKIMNRVAWVFDGEVPEYGYLESTK